MLVEEAECVHHHVLDPLFEAGHVQSEHHVRHTTRHVAQLTETTPALYRPVEHQELRVVARQEVRHIHILQACHFVKLIDRVPDRLSVS